MAKRSPVAQLIPQGNGPVVAPDPVTAAPKKAARGRATTPGQIVIASPVIDVIQVEVRGTSSLIVHAWTVKAIRQMLYKQMKISESGKEAKDPHQDFMESRTISQDGWDGIPCTAFKCAIAEATRQVEGLTMVLAKRLIFVLPEGRSVHQTIEIPQTENNPAMDVPFGNTEIVRIYGEPTLRCDMVRIDKGSTADIRFRAEYKEWSARLTVKFNSNIISRQQVISLIRLAGLSEGVGEWRPSSPEVMSGSHGTWEVIGMA